MKRSDPIGSKFYLPLARAEIFSRVSFYLAAFFSIAILFVDRNHNFIAHDFIQAIFVLSVVCHFLSGIVIKIYFSARAHASRIADFVSNAFSIPLTISPSEGYYNTAGKDTFVRLGESVLENTIFTKAIVGRMLISERLMVTIYALIWLGGVLNRTTDLAIIAVAAQVLFSEQLLSRWIRMEWLRSRVEKVHDDLYTLFRSFAEREGNEFRARVVQALILYETSKAQAGISLSTRVFEKLNDELSRNWQTTRSQLGVDESTATTP